MLCAPECCKVPPGGEKKNRLRKRSFTQLRGVQTNIYTRPAFDAASISVLAEPDRFYFNNQHVKHVFVAVDPAAGGDHSKFAIVSAVYVDGHKLVVSTHARVFFLCVLCFFSFLSSVRTIASCCFLRTYRNNTPRKECIVQMTGAVHEQAFVELAFAVCSAQSRQTR